MSDPRSSLPRWNKDLPRTRLTPWKEDPADPGPTVIVDVDGVVANMDKFTYLIAGETSRERDWATFHRSFNRARLVTSGSKLIGDLTDAGLEIAWSTTRPEQFARATWRWMQHHKLPLGPAMFRNHIKDGPRSAVDIKLRHWWSWYDKYGENNPIVGWIDDDVAAINALRAHGCPAWHHKDLIRHARKGGLLATLRDGPIDMALLDEHLVQSRPIWQANEDAWQARRSEWWSRQKSRRRTR